MQLAEPNFSANMDMEKKYIKKLHKDGNISFEVFILRPPRGVDLFMMG